MTKPRRIDFYHEDWLNGTVRLSWDERGVYITVCALIYARGGPISREEILEHGKHHQRSTTRLLDHLVEIGKLTEKEGKLDQNRCESELKRSQKRIETFRKNGGNGGRPSRNNNELEEPSGFDDENRPVRTVSNQQPATSKKEELESRSTSLEEPESSKRPAQAPFCQTIPKDGALPAGYAFYGRVVHLLGKQFDEWRKSFYGIPDLRAWLVSQDAFYDKTLVGEERGKWFIRCSRAAEKEHQRYIITMTRAPPSCAIDRMALARSRYPHISTERLQELAKSSGCAEYGPRGEYQAWQILRYGEVRT